MDRKQSNQGSKDDAREQPQDTVRVPIKGTLDGLKNVAELGPLSKGL
jgi:hypothetical protein